MVNASFPHRGYVIGNSKIPASPKTISHHCMLVLHHEFSNHAQGIIGIEKDGMEKKDKEDKKEFLDNFFSNLKTLFSEEVP